MLIFTMFWNSKKPINAWNVILIHHFENTYRTLLSRWRVKNIFSRIFKKIGFVLIRIKLFFENWTHHLTIGYFFFRFIKEEWIYFGVYYWQFDKIMAWIECGSRNMFFLMVGNVCGTGGELKLDIIFRGCIPEAMKE